MSALKDLQALQQVLKMSPIPKLEKAFPNSLELSKQLDIFRKDLETLLDKCHTPLRIVLMGEVKAGKSTVLNALAGGQVSPTNVTETTASIIEIKHANEKRGQLIKKTGETIEGTTDEIYQLLDQHRGDQDFYSGVAVTKFEHPLPNLRKLHLVDTPGLATVTEENENRTMEYIQSSDVVLWVFSAHHLGQWDIEEQLAEVKSYGKPIVAIVSRLDEIDGTAEALEEYVNDRLGFFVDEVFAISAYQAFEGTVNNDSELLAVSRFTQLVKFLEENIEKQTDRVQDESLLNSGKALAEKEKYQHQMLGDTIDFLLGSMERRKSEIRYYNEGLKRKIKLELENWANNDLFDEEKQNLLTKVSVLSRMPNKQDYEGISEELRMSISSERILGLLEEKYADMNAIFKREWNIAIEAIGEKISVEEEEFKEHQSILYKNMDLSLDSFLPESENLIADGATKGAVIGGAYGFAAAAYAAVLGPAAAGLTMGAALAAVMPPVLIIGAITGIATKFVFSNKKKEEYKREVIRAIDEAKAKVRTVFIPTMVDHYESQSTLTANDLYNRICEFMTQGWTENELLDLKQTIRTYSESISRWERGNESNLDSRSPAVL